MRNRAKVAALAALISIFGAALPAQTLYASDRDAIAIVEANPDTGEAIATVAMLSDPENGIATVTGLATHPATGELRMAYQDDANVWRVGAVDLVTGVVTPLADLGGHSTRDLTHDGAGKLWITCASGGPTPHAVATVDLATGELTLRNASPPTDRNKIAYDPATDTMYLLGRGTASGAVEFYSFSPGAPESLTPIPLSGVSLAPSANPPMVFDRTSGLLRTANGSGTWRTITLAGLVVDAGSASGNWGGLAYDRATTAPPIKVSGVLIR